MRFHWGHGIALFYSMFAAGMFFAVFKSTQFDNSLVVDDYYAQDIRYQERIDQRANSRSLSQALLLDKTGDDYALEFPIDDVDGEIAGRLQFYRSSSSRFDRFVELAIDETGHMSLPTEELIGGHWKLIVEWSAGGRHYFDEFELYLAA